MSPARATEIVWRKSSKSGESECIEVAVDGEIILVRDSKDTSGPTLQFSGQAWRSFVSALRVPDSIHHDGDGGGRLLGR